jgi:hypothetical protein
LLLVAVAEGVNFLVVGVLKFSVRSPSLLVKSSRSPSRAGAGVRPFHLVAAAEVVPQRFPRWDQVKSSSLAVVVAVPNLVPVVMGQLLGRQQAVLHQVLEESGRAATVVPVEVAVGAQIRTAVTG